MATVITVRRDVTLPPRPEPPPRPAAPVLSAPVRVMPAEPKPIAKTTAPPPPPRMTVQTTPAALSRNFKEFGSPTAPIGCEVYTDLECPPCAKFWSETVPQLMAEYVETGKLKLTTRDFPLPQHKYARIAARYANAAGLIGKYQVAFNQILATQSTWHQTGDVETPLSAVLDADDLRRVKGLATEDGEAEDSVKRDRALAADDHIEQTPSIVLVWSGHRQKLVGAPTFEELKTRLDQILAQ